MAPDLLPFREIGYTAEECERDMRRMTNGERGCANPDEHLMGRGAHMKPDDWIELDTEPLELAPLMVHTVKVGNLVYSWEDYSPSIRIRQDLHEAFSTSAVISTIENAYIHEQGEAYVEFTTYSFDKRKAYHPATSMSATITCHPKGEPE